MEGGWAMQGENPEHNAVSFTIRFQPGLPAGHWQVTLPGLNDDVILFSSALDLLRWLEDLEHGPRQAEKGLR